MTWEEAKDQIAKGHGHANWQIAEYRVSRDEIDVLYKEVGQLYASSKHDEACEGCRIHQESFSGDLIIIKPEFKP
jgi:hypothetical protein